MCDRREAQMAQNLAADTLTAVCLSLCTDEVGLSLKQVYDTTLVEAMPSRFKELLAKLK